MKGKKGQITFFIILGIIILLSFSLVTYLSINFRNIAEPGSTEIDTQEQNLPLETNQVQNEAEIQEAAVPEAPLIQPPESIEASLEEIPIEESKIPLWLSISIGIFVFLIITFSLLYWLSLNADLNTLIAYISWNIALGFSAAAIAKRLEENGWKNWQIEKAFEKVLKKR